MTHRKIKSLYKLTRNFLFTKIYYCMYCDMIDFEKQWLQKHIWEFHDECGKIIRLFECKKCRKRVFEHKILKHIARHN